MLSKALEGVVIGLESLDERLWQVWFGPLRIGVFDERQHRMLSPSECRRRGL